MYNTNNPTKTIEYCRTLVINKSDNKLELLDSDGQSQYFHNQNHLQQALFKQLRSEGGSVELLYPGVGSTFFYLNENKTIEQHNSPEALFASMACNKDSAWTTVDRATNTAIRWHWKQPTFFSVEVKNYSSEEERDKAQQAFYFDDLDLDNAPESTDWLSDPSKKAVALFFSAISFAAPIVDRFRTTPNAFNKLNDSLDEVNALIPKATGHSLVNAMLAGSMLSAVHRQQGCSMVAPMILGLALEASPAYGGWNPKKTFKKAGGTVSTTFKKARESTTTFLKKTGGELSNGFKKAVTTTHNNLKAAEKSLHKAGRDLDRERLKVTNNVGKTLQKAANDVSREVSKACEDTVNELGRFSKTIKREGGKALRDIGREVARAPGNIEKQLDNMGISKVLLPGVHGLNELKKIITGETKLNGKTIQKAIDKAGRDVSNTLKKAGGDISKEWKRMPPEMQTAIIIAAAVVATYGAAYYMLAAGGQISVAGVFTIGGESVAVNLVTYSTATGLTVAPEIIAGAAAIAAGAGANKTVKEFEEAKAREETIRKQNQESQKTREEAKRKSESQKKSESQRKPESQQKTESVKARKTQDQPEKTQPVKESNTSDQISKPDNKGSADKTAETDNDVLRTKPKLDSHKQRIEFDKNGNVRRRDAGNGHMDNRISKNSKVLKKSRETDKELQLKTGGELASAEHHQTIIEPKEVYDGSGLKIGLQHDAKVSVNSQATVDKKGFNTKSDVRAQTDTTIATIKAEDGRSFKQQCALKGPSTSFEANAKANLDRNNGPEVGFNVEARGSLASVKCENETPQVCLAGVCGKVKIDTEINTGGAGVVFGVGSSKYKTRKGGSLTVDAGVNTPELGLRGTVSVEVEKQPPTAEELQKQRDQFIKDVYGGCDHPTISQPGYDVHLKCAKEKRAADMKKTKQKEPLPGPRAEL